MRTEPEVLAPWVLGVSWLVAAGALPGALAAAAASQGVAAVLGGCHWIGLSLPVDRQVWALVNQPEINFASTPAAAGYWLGSLLLPVLAAAAALPLLPRRQSLLSELLVIHWVWSAAVVAGAWLPLIDPDDGHLARWLALNDWPSIAVWAAPGLAAAVALLPAVRLLQLARRRRPQLSRRLRISLVLLHLVAPSGCWLAVAIVTSGVVPFRSLAGVAIVVAATLTMAWWRFPAPHAQKLRRPTTPGIAGTATLAVALILAAWFAGRPIGGSRAGVLWSAPQATNNIRPWIETRPLIVATWQDGPVEPSGD
jgi:hypothetical protein